MKQLIRPVISHLIALLIGFAAGIYLLPILIAPKAPSTEQLQQQTAKAVFKGQFRHDLKGSDLLHRGEGVVSISDTHVALQGTISAGPDYKLYFSPEFVETEADFKRLKSQMVRAGDIKTFDNFVVPVPATIDIKQYKAVIVWCETFGQFITAAKYQ